MKTLLVVDQSVDYLKDTPDELEIIPCSTLEDYFNPIQCTFWRIDEEEIEEKLAELEEDITIQEEAGAKPEFLQELKALRDYIKTYTEEHPGQPLEFLLG